MVVTRVQVLLFSENQLNASLMRSTKPRRIQFLLRQRLMASSDANLNDCSSAQRLEHIKDEKSLQAVSNSSVVDVTTELSSASTLCDIPHSLDKFASGMEFNGKSVELPLAGRFTTEVTRGAHATSTVALRCNDASQRRVPSSEVCRLYLLSRDTSLL